MSPSQVRTLVLDTLVQFAKGDASQRAREEAQNYAQPRFSHHSWNASILYARLRQKYNASEGQIRAALVNLHKRGLIERDAPIYPRDTVRYYAHREPTLTERAAETRRELEGGAA
jgi:hypothetical protein